MRQDLGKRIKRKPIWHNDYDMSNLAVIALNAQAYVEDLPQTFEESQNRSDCDYWLKAIEIELKAHEANKTWTLVAIMVKAVPFLYLLIINF
ncbi:hypothetical protein QE152_g41071 [Popillia japonica]|uniref:Uncharacterized protein n=1 Tax=Popillia japonica TaxID=7064 RepID=A0AAW1H1A4_POPJA